jgi:uncharacterized membrane protein
MRTGGRERSDDLALTAVVTLASLVLIALPFEGLLKALLLLPAVLLLPGYALSAALFPPRAISRGERAVYVLVFSVSAAALGGLLWQFAFGLGRGAWAFVLATITLAACAVAQRRRTRMPIKQRERSRPRPSRGQGARLDMPTASAALIAAGAAIAALAIAIDGLQEQRAESHFSALWVAPQTPASEVVEVGISNHQGAVHDYRLEIEAAGREIRSWRGRLGSNGAQRVRIPPGAVPAGARLVVSLYRDGVLYRRTELQTGVSA